MPSLHDLAIDLINEAKGAKNVPGKLYNLEQIKEIAFHRDTSILAEIAPDIINDFMVDRSSTIRKFLISFAADWLQFDFAAAIPLSLSMFGFLLASESGDGPLRQISTELTKIYDRTVMHITGLPIKARNSGPNVADPKSYWNSLRTIVSRLIDMISSDRAELVRAQSLRLAEIMILFGLPAEKLSSDPRLAKSRPQSGDSSKGLSACDIPLHHPFINRNDLEQEAESIFSKMLLWASKGGPQGHPFSPGQMSLLGGNIANIASLRPKKSTNAATALVQVLQGKGSVCHLMSKDERDSLARNIQKLLRATYASPDPDGQMGKLRSALDGLVALAVTAVETPVVEVVGSKRPMAADDDAEGLEPGAEGQDMRASAIAAVDAAENSIKTKNQKTDVITPVGPRVILSGVAGAVSASAAAVDTDLSAELSNFPDMVSSVKLVSLQAPPSASPSNLALQTTGFLSTSGLLIKPSAATTDVYSDLALQSMQRILDSFCDIKKFGAKASSAHLKLSVRMVLSMTLLELAEAKAALRVPLFSCLSSVAVGFMDQVPNEVYIPRSLWVVLSHILNGHLGPPTAQIQGHKGGLNKESIELISSVLTEIYNRSNAAKNNEGEWSEEKEVKKPNLLEILYADACLAVLSRLLQGIETRAAARDMMISLPAVPSGCLFLLRLLVHTGTRAVAPMQGVRRDTLGPRNRGTRAEALSLLGQLVFSSDEGAGYSSLYQLLWCASAEDFEIRSKAVALLVGEVVPAEESIFETVSLFSVHSVISVVGADQVRKRMGEIAAFSGVDTDMGLKKVEGSEEVQGSDSIEENGVVRVDGEGMEVVEDVTENEIAVVSDDDETVSLEVALDSYDSGKRFQGIFTETKAPSSSSITVMLKGKTEAQFRKSLQLLSQLCISEPSLLKALFGIYGAAAASSRDLISSDPGPDLGSNSGIEPTVEIKVEAVAGTAAVKVVAGRVENKYTVICDIIEAELSNIIPIISKRRDSSLIFSMLSDGGADPLIRPLLEISLDIMHSDYSVPVGPDLIKTVKAYIDSLLFLRSIDGYDATAPASAASSSAPTATSSSAPSSAPSSASNDAFEEKKRTASLRMLFPLFGGLSSTELIEILPKLLRSFGDQPEVLKSAFKRMYSARPPPLSKAVLFAALHRLDCESSNLKQKSVLDVISLCLGNKDDFRSDVIREALSDLLLDAVPAQALMRTAILSAQSYAVEMKKFMLSDVIPSLIRKRVWNAAPKVWDGVNHALKLFAEHKNAEPSLRCVLGLPGAQLKSLLKIAPKVKPLLSSLLKALSAEEREETISGRWAGLTEIIHIPPVVDAEKAKILKELTA